MKKLYIETYGCQMNFADSEVVAAILKDSYALTGRADCADLILINTCSIRDHAEQRIHHRLQEFLSLKRKRQNLQIGLLGCMAERLQEKLLAEEPVLDFVAGPDSYRSLPGLVEKSGQGLKRSEVQLSETETYDDILPVRYATNGVSAYISIMRGCNNFCSYCVVPYTRGRERSRNPMTILREAEVLLENGYREVTLLGQNVNSYRWQDGGQTVDFARLLAMAAGLAPELRVRYATSHPKDISDELIETMAQYENICKYIHLPVQSGSNAMLKRMNRVYTREYYLERIRKIREVMPGCGISTDIIAGFCGETEADHRDTLSIMREVGYDSAYMFKYSRREGTMAAKRFDDDVPEAEKGRRLDEIIALQNQLSLESNRRDVGKTFKVLIEGVSKRSDADFLGRNSQNKVIIFPRHNLKIGSYATVRVHSCTQATLMGDLADEPKTPCSTPTI